VNARIICRASDSQGDWGTVSAPAPNVLGADTEEVSLSPELIAALRRIAPKRRHSKLPYVIGLALFTVAVVLGRSGATRGLIASWRQGSVSSSGALTAPLEPARKGDIEASPQGSVGEAVAASAAVTTASPSTLEMATPPPAARVKSHRERTPRRGNAVRR
jgi:hypothetical protein